MFCWLTRWKVLKTSLKLANRAAWPGPGEQILFSREYIIKKRLTVRLCICSTSNMFTSVFYLKNNIKLKQQLQLYRIFKCSHQPWVKISNTVEDGKSEKEREKTIPKDYSGWMGNGSILPMQQPFAMICTPSAIYLSRKGRPGITYNVHRHMNCDAWNLRADDSSDSLSCCLPLRMNAHLDLWPQLGASNYKHTLESDFPVCSDRVQNNLIQRVFKHTSLPSPPSQHALGHGRVLSAGTIGINVEKMSRMSGVGQREGVCLLAVMQLVNLS